MRTLLLFALLAAPAAGLEPYLVKDVNPVPSPAGGGPAAFAALGNRAVFEASDGTDRVLWTSDGTPEGTRVLVDTCPGCPDSAELFAQVGERLYFFAYAEPDRAYAEAVRKSLWVTDGSAVQRLSGQISPGRESALAGGVLYFRADGGLWRTDGTPAGTRLAVPGPNPSQLTAFDGQVWFVRGRDLWRGTALVRRFSRPPRILGGVGRRLVIAAGDELLALDGLLARGLSVIDSAVLGGRLWLIAETRRGQELWVSDGFTARQLTSIPRKQAFFAPSEALYLTLPRSLTAGRLVFAAHDGAHGPELWTSDGTAGGTRLLRDLCPGPCAGIAALGIVHQGRLYFTGTDGMHGHELWSTDGSRVDLVRDVCPGPCDGDPGSLAAMGDRVLFAADDGEHGIELWTAEGRLSDFEPPVPWSALHGAALKGTFLFGANDGEHGLELWATDGSSSRFVKDLDETDMGGSFPSGLSALGDTAFFFADDGEHGYELWKSDGTGAGTALVAGLVPGEEPRRPPDVRGSAVVGNELYLAVDKALWRTDGAAVHKVAEVDAREPVAFQGSLFFMADRALWRRDSEKAVRIAGPDNPMFLTVHAGRLWFFDDLGLWSSDGTTAVLESENRFGLLLASLGDALLWSDPEWLRNGERRIGPAADPGTAWTVFQGRLYYTVDGRLWVSDGEESRPVPGAPGGATFAPLGDRLLFTTEGSGIPLWMTDGVEAVKVRDLAPRFLGRLDLLAVGPRVFFPALDPATGLELWAVEP